jgi:Lrp/AsnC family leucine-responsive transcriptional regulator
MIHTERKDLSTNISHLAGETSDMPQISNPMTDPRNVALLQALQEDPRQPVTKLAASVGMSAPAVKERLSRLEETGVIRGYRLDLDPAALGWPITAYVRVRPTPGQLPKVAELAQKMPQVVECHRVTGEDCFIMKVHLDALENLDLILDRFLRYGQTTTSIVQSTPVPLRAPPLPAADGNNR